MNQKITIDELRLEISAENWDAVQAADVSDVEDMSGLFKGVYGIENLDLSGWITTSVTDMRSMFYDSDFNTPLNFDTSSVLSMGMMFGHSQYNHPLHFDTSSVTDMHHMFYDSQFNHPLSFDTSSARWMHSMFCDSQFNHQLNFNTENVESMDSMFRNSKYNHPLPFNTSKVEDMSCMLSGLEYCHPINFDIFSIKNVNNMFKHTDYTGDVPCMMELGSSVQDADNLVRDLSLRNCRLHTFLKTGEGDADLIISDFENHQDILATIKDRILSAEVVTNLVDAPSISISRRF